MRGQILNLRLQSVVISLTFRSHVQHGKQIGGFVMHDSAEIIQSFLHKDTIDGT